MPKCAICGKITTKQTGVQFPSDTTRFTQFCHNLKLNTKTTNKKGIICYDHFDPKDLIKEGGRTIGISRTALPKSSRLTLDRLLEKNLGMSTSAVISSQKNIPCSSARQSFASLSSALPPHMPSGSAAVLGSAHIQNHQQQQNAVVQDVASWHGVLRHDRQMHGQTWHGLSENTEQLVDTVKKTLVLFRDVNEPLSQSAATDWLLRSFNLSANSIRHISSPSTVANSQIFFIVFDEINHAENILEISKSERKSHQCVFGSAIELLKDGADFLNKSELAYLPPSVPSAVVNHSNVIDILRVLLQSNSSGECAAPTLSDENAWRNLAAAMVPAYNNLVAAASSQLQHRTLHSNLAAAAVREKTNTVEENSTPIQTIMSQIDQIIRQSTR